ncbi:antibiotic biosynthesis monooxygenase [Streptomyces sp. PKU-EA00015]|uniref:antibiotic biosynthesis monooxygenase family protein n=1 Tax=Streptomyces sp. PKU-EA00015 TaxID=2748326 RepID=UPI0015A02D91|nr:antibiotic biosynthesis monooxygenase family protein [Streptomyces sp. PKU-EA00015]NWF26889.1 antibiotic biosynthesis monooxygenase [Streptomyces sp. PKU-EA00015]
MREELKHWSSGNWHVTEGKADDFIDAWTEFLAWTKGANEGFVKARLIRDLSDPNHFVSFSAWRSPEAMSEWQGKPEFADLFGKCRALCDDMTSGIYESTVTL